MQIEIITLVCCLALLNKINMAISLKKKVASKEIAVTDQRLLMKCFCFSFSLVHYTLVAGKN